MKMERWRIFVALGILVVLIALIQSEPVMYYTEVLSRNAVQQQKMNDPLYQEILQKAKEIDQAAIEPRIDRIWKLIPGYNGQKLDVDATYKQANRKTGTFVPIINEISPTKSPWDLPPNPIYRGNPNKNAVALMINVAWGNEHLETILHTLDKRQVKATFFLDGSWLHKNPEQAKAIVAAGHEIGSHAYTHPLMSRLTRERIIEELEKTNKKIEELLHQKVTLFAPPSGDFDGRVVKLAWEREMLTILWTLDTVDWRNPPVNEMVQKINSKVEAGNLILMHPTPATAKGLNDMIIGIQNKGLSIDIVSEVISTNRTRLVEIPSDF